MRASAAAILLTTILAAAAAAAAEPVTAAKPDFSRDTLLRLLAAAERENPQPRVRFRVGAVEFTALGTEWRFNYLPIMMPLSGTRLGVTQEWPDPFLLTGTQIAYPPRVWRQRRGIEKELKRIGKTSAKVTVKTE